MNNLKQLLLLCRVSQISPVSSTGHMIITQALLGVDSSPFVKAFTVNIQFGAILSVVILYWKRFFKLNTSLPDNLKNTGSTLFVNKWGIVRRFFWKFDFYWKLFIAMIPAGVIALLFGDYIDAMLESVIVVAVMLLWGIFCCSLIDGSTKVTDQSITWKRSLKIGFSVYCHDSRRRFYGHHCWWNGTKLSRKNAAEFLSFLPYLQLRQLIQAYKLRKIRSKRC